MQFLGLYSLNTSGAVVSLYTHIFMIPLFARLKKPIPKSKPFYADHREAVSDVFHGPVVESKTTCASSSHTREKEEMISMLNALDPLP